MANKKTIFLVTVGVFVVGNLVSRLLKMSNEGSIDFTWRLKLEGSLFDPRIVAYFNYKNPNDIGVTVTAIRGDLMYKGKVFAQVNEISPVVIQPLSTTEIPVVVSGLDATFFATILQVLTSKFNLSDFRYKGYITVFGINIPIDQTLSA